MATSSLSYLVSTAGHSQQQNDLNPHNVASILQLVNEGAQEFGEEKVVGFTTVDSDERWLCDRYSFPELVSLSDALAKDLYDGGVIRPTQEKRIISLLCPTGLDFLISWIALMRIGYGVVLIAPQCSPTAIAHLIHSSGSAQLIYHPKYTDLAQSAQSLDASVSLVSLPQLRNLVSVSSDTEQDWEEESVPIDRETVSHIFHTSGTSGTPKPIPNTHYRSVSVLPRRALPTYLATNATQSDTGSSSTLTPGEPAAYTTTPLFHGGVSDLLRAWMARSMIYFYPTSDMPITTQHLVSSIEACQAPPSPLKGIRLTAEQEEERKRRFEVKAFLSVPYILTILTEDTEGKGMETLRRMNYVSTGGAPLDRRVGDGMVEKGVRLVSRLGSSECGCLRVIVDKQVLMSSHRDYETENDWEWLRNDSDYADALRFEQVPDEPEKYEMVVTDEWQSKTKSNREDGSYATGDLYIQHPEKKGVWKYVGRGDDVIVLSNGEKASPGPIESALRSSPLLGDALVVGSDRDQLGVLLFPKDSAKDESTLLDELSSLLDEANKSSPSFAQVSRDMCRIVAPSPDGTAQSLPKSSKGTVQRGLAYGAFKAEIEAIYTVDPARVAEQSKRSREEIRTIVRKIVGDVTKSKVKSGTLEVETDLFSWGVDSLMATRIRGGLKKELNPPSELPRNIAFEYPSISRLSQFLHDLQEGIQIDADDKSHQLMRDLVEKYRDFSSTSDAPQPSTSSNKASSGKTVLLTGATGSLGSFLLDHLANQPEATVDRLVCLVRAKDDNDAKSRVQDTLHRRQLHVEDRRFDAYAADLTRADLGLDPSTLQRLVGDVDAVVHAAWPVHFGSSLISFEDNIKGTRHLLDLIAQSPRQAKLYYCSSLASVLGSPSPTVDEQSTDDPSTAGSIGYSQSKWVTERICRSASESVILRDRVKILRVGQLCGDTKTGYWNEKEGWPLMIRTAQTTGCLPLIDEKPSWLPVDVAARAISDLVLENSVSTQDLIYHIVHPRHIDWATVLEGVEAANVSFERVSPEEWLKRVEGLEEEDPSRQMMSMWQAAYGSGPLKDVEKRVVCDNALKVSRALREVEPVDTENVVRMVQAWQKSGFLR